MTNVTLETMLKMAIHDILHYHAFGGYTYYYKNVKDKYIENIQELQESCIEYKLKIDRFNYDLEAMLVHLKNEIERYWQTKVPFEEAII